ncbi:MAG: HDOD domain-containing protein [Desulfobacterota bacterium]|nr:HDOD domain-containing protein [Thermodesulfobacteriota bacterium]
MAAEKLPPIVIDPKTFLREHCTLPALPEVVHEIQKLIKSDNVEIVKVSQIIAKDPALVAQILKIVNSAYYSLPREVADVRYAIAFLGLHEIERILLTLSVINTLGVKEKKELTGFWFHSFLAALCTKHFAARYEPRLSFEELWSAAMLHDIGKLVYLKFFPTHYTAIKTLSTEKGFFFCDAEQELKLPSSSYLGVLLCDHWRLPTKIRDACETHAVHNLANLKGNDSSSAFKRMICLGNAASILALNMNMLRDEKKHEIKEKMMSVLACDEPGFLTLMAEVYELRSQAERFLEQFG